jgi:hypothetical protein
MKADFSHDNAPFDTVRVKLFCISMELCEVKKTKRKHETTYDIPDYHVDIVEYMQYHPEY